MLLAKEAPPLAPTTIPIPKDPHDEWITVPLGEKNEDPKFEVKRLPPEQFEAVYDCVDNAFGKTRPRALFNWLYRENPYGLARVWSTTEVATGRLLRVGSNFPWPIWRGDRPCMGSLGGDAATVTDWQRKGLSGPQRRISRSHPMRPSWATIAGPNESSRALSEKFGDQSSTLGELVGGVAVLGGADLGRRLGLPMALARPVGALAGGVFAAWRGLTLRGGRGHRFEVVDRCPSDFDAVTLATMRFEHWWTPHNSVFLNWRYVDHPIETYQPLALVDPTNDVPAAYALVRLAGAQSTLAEFAASPADAPVLLAHVLRFAREAGAESMNFFSTPAWRHWALFRRTGFLAYRTGNFLEAKDHQDKKYSEDIMRWQLTPGDRDYH
ncbi:MAG: hypothetical protein CL931_09320 [Deltaproteobacteria bacterium]|nr:hypothetical protein [Deltaproteobacteria bacterium]